MTYTLDTNILIGLIQRYPRDIFPSIWEAVEDAIDNETACICQAVLAETERGGDELHAWAKAYPGFLCALAQDEITIVQEISAAHPGWVRESQNEADPWVIAHAVVDDRIVVTEETRKGPNTEERNQKIPNIADEHGVQVIKFFQLA